MKRILLMLLLACACGCGTTTDTRRGGGRRRSRRRTPVMQSGVVCDFDIVKIPRSQYHKLERLWRLTEIAGVYGPGEKLLALNGLRVERSDKRFVKEFSRALAAVRSQERKLHVRMVAGGKEQVFNVGDELRNETLFIWTESDSVTGHHFRRARYRMTLALDSVRQGTAEFRISWQVRTGSPIYGTGAIPPLDTTVELEKGQSVVIAPVGFGGHDVGRAFLSGVDESAVELTFFVITPTDIREKPAPPPTDAPPETQSRKEYHERQSYPG